MNTSREQLKQDVIAEIVKAVSKLGTCKRAKVGAVLTRDGRIISTGYNGSPPGQPHCLDIGCLMEDGHCRRTTHAEANAIAFAARYGISTQGATLYVYGWITGGDVGVCSICAKLAKSAGIVHTVVIPLESIDHLQERHLPDFPYSSAPLIDCKRRPEGTGPQIFGFTAERSGATVEVIAEKLCNRQGCIEGPHFHPRGSIGTAVMVRLLDPEECYAPKTSFGQLHP